MPNYAELGAVKSRRDEHRGRVGTSKEKSLEQVREQDREQKRGRELDTERERWEEKKKSQRAYLDSRSNSCERHKRALSASSNYYRESGHDGLKRWGDPESLSKRRRHE